MDENVDTSTIEKVKDWIARFKVGQIRFRMCRLHWLVVRCAEHTTRTMSGVEPRKRKSKYYLLPWSKHAYFLLKFHWLRA